MKLSKAQVAAPVHAIPELRFEDQRLTSFGGLVIFQALFQRLRLKERLRKAVSGARTVAYQPHTLVMMLVVHLLLGFRRLRDRDYYRDDPMVQRVLGLHRLPDVSTWTRGLAEFTSDDVAGMRTANCEVVTERIREEQLRRVTADFDGSVLSTRGHAEGSAIGYNRQRKGARSYYHAADLGRPRGRPVTSPRPLTPRTRTACSQSIALREFPFSVFHFGFWKRCGGRRVARGSGPVSTHPARYPYIDLAASIAAVGSALKQWCWNADPDRPASEQ